MLVSDILRTLPASLDWMVLFNLSTMRQLADDSVVRGMYHLPPALNLNGYTHVVLTSMGRFLAPENQSQLVEAISGEKVSPHSSPDSLSARFAQKLALFPLETADCLGMGEIPPYAPVLLHVKANAGWGEAQAVFETKPVSDHYELLPAVGVQFLGGQQQGDYYLAQFRNRLPIHIHAGILSHFTRTGHCNLFFLQQGNIDANLEQGLLKAAEQRITWGWLKGATRLVEQSEQAVKEALAMTCFPPAPSSPFPYGDLVPLGFVLKALRTASHRLKELPLETSQMPVPRNLTPALQNLERFLLEHREEELWAFHRQRLITATDSALVLQGLIPDSCVSSISRLERFADGEGGYYPQQWSEERQKGKMVIDEHCRHWCQADYATTCLIRSLQQEANVATPTPLSVLAKGMNQRSGLYFANPYLVDWALAGAIALDNDETAQDLRRQLKTEILASMNPDCSFGNYDVALSTALAILTLAKLNYRGRWLRAAQLWLLNQMSDQGNFPVSIPFYSSFRIDHNLSNAGRMQLLLLDAAINQEQRGHQQICTVAQQYHSISLYEDSHGLIGKALAVLALAEPHHAEAASPEPRPQSNPHPRYQCQTHSEYIAQFALPPYCHSKIEGN